MINCNLNYRAAGCKAAVRLLIGTALATPVGTGGDSAERRDRNGSRRRGRLGDYHRYGAGSANKPSTKSPWR